MNQPRCKRAIISVSNKDGIVDFAKTLVSCGIEILSTGGSAALLKRHKIPVTDVAQYTQFPEIMAGRVKTLHPKIHGGILARRGEDDEIMAEMAIQPIDLVIINLYPFEATIAEQNCALSNAIEQIDIGGPAMIRAAAKNHAAVTVIVSPQDYVGVGQELVDNQQQISAKTRFRLASKAFTHTARYDGIIANYFNSHLESGQQQPFPNTLSLQFEQAEPLRYGENPHQRAVFYRENPCDIACIATAKQLQGKALSFNNLADADTALECVKQFPEPLNLCVIVKHANPCGVAVGETLQQSYLRAYETDPVSAFGGIIAFNHCLDADTAAAIIRQQFVEVIIAPEVSPQALKIFQEKPNIRILSSGQWDAHLAPGQDIKRLTGGFLVQDRDLAIVSSGDLKQVTQRAPSESEFDDLIFAWQVAKFVKSNAVVYARNGQTIGIGCGQTSRVSSAKIALSLANEAGFNCEGCVMASDAFFPFADGVEAAAKAGIRAIIQPGGSKRDDEVISCANQYDMAMVFTSMRHFRH